MVLIIGNTVTIELLFLKNRIYFSGFKKILLRFSMIFNNKLIFFENPGIMNYLILAIFLLK